MTDEPKFSPFAPTEAPKFAAEPVNASPAKKPRGKKKVAKPKAPKQKAKPKHDLAAQVKPLGADSLLPPARKRKPRPTMIPVEILPALAGLSGPDTAILMDVMNLLQDVPKKSRAKIVAALAKVFS